MKTPYGLKDGRPVLASEVARGLACSCICPCCGGCLEAHQGEVKVPYFAHDDGADCADAYQTALHILAKEVLSEYKQLRLPELVVDPSEELGQECLRQKVFRQLVPPMKTIIADRVALEHKIGGIVPDVIFQVGTKLLLVEIWVTHRIDRDKRAIIESLELPTVEFNFSKTDRTVTKEDLYRALVLGQRSWGCGSGEWIFHPKQRQAQEEVDQEFREKKPALEEDLARWQRKKDEKRMQEYERLQQEKKRQEQAGLNNRLREYGRQAEERRIAKEKEREEKRKREFLF